jgi:DNA-binding NtrC family response regulator
VIVHNLGELNLAILWYNKITGSAERGGGTMAKGKVLIIEDRRENIVFMANDVLKPLGYQVITAMDGETGLQKALQEKPDIIITDLRLSGRDGLSILAALQEHGLSIPTIMMTFHGSEEIAARAFRLGVVDYLIKPFTVEQVREALERAERSKARPGAELDTAALEQRLADWENEAARVTGLLAQKEESLQISERRVVALGQALRSQAQELKRQLAEAEKLAKSFRDALDKTEAMLKDLDLES